MSYFEFNGHRSDEFGIRIQKKNIYSAPKFDMTLQSIPGKNGDLIVSNKRYQNVGLSYTCYVVAKTIDELSNKITLIKNWLYRDVDSYHDLTDSYDTKFKRRAIFNNKLDISDEVSKIGIFTINFSCKPQRYLITGETIEIYNSSFELINPYSLSAKPYLKLNGTGIGRLIIQNDKGNFIWSFNDIDEYVELDSEEMNFFKGTLLKNSSVEGVGFPELVEGTNVISFDGDIISVEIVPRWVSL